jgi:hypothetical protein
MLVFGGLSLRRKIRAREAPAWIVISGLFLSGELQIRCRVDAAPAIGETLIRL